MTERTLSSKPVFTSKNFSVRSDQVRLPHGPVTTMHVIRHPGSVVLLPMPDPDHIILARQYRYAIDQWTWELPAGTIHSNETPEQAAVRECHEEIAKLPQKLELLKKFFPTPGYSDELMIFFRLTELTDPTHAAETDEDEDIKAGLFTLEEALLLVANDSPDMKTALGLRLI
ncbi:MAG: ADP-ribose pyrophosphatase [Acidobacteria bacterium]|nr:ADP-ribose pyrophosphatase [Acidobacteriota bacterium]